MHDVRDRLSGRQAWWRGEQASAGSRPGKTGHSNGSGRLVTTLLAMITAAADADQQLIAEHISHGEHVLDEHTAY
jgi:hypothetical protein